MRRYHVFALALLWLFALPAYAQFDSATVSGVIQDGTGGVLPGVDVTLTSVGTGLERRTVTNEAGSVVNWKVEWLAAMIIFREGFTRDSLHVGDPINMTACVAKDGSHNAAAQFVTLPSAFENHRIGLCKAVSR